MTDVPEGTIAEVLDWVDDDPDRAQAALDAERAGANRSTLINQLEPIAQEANPMSDEPATTDEETGLAPGPEQPVDVELYAADAGTVIGPLHVRDADVEVPDDADLTPEETDDAPEPIDGEQVEYLQAVHGTNGLALAINGTVYLFNAQTVGALKQAVDQTVVGLAL